MALNPEGRKIANVWDTAKDEAAGEQCRSYGAPNIMQVPGRIDRVTADYDERFGATSGPWTTDLFVEAVYASLKNPAKAVRRN